MSVGHEMMNRAPYILEGPRWEIDPVRTYAPFFRALPTLGPPGSLLCLAEGVWDTELTTFFARHERNPPDGLSRPAEFEGGAHVPLDQSVLDELAEIAEHHAEPEIAIYVAVSCGTEQLLEWFDAPSDPISVALSIPEGAVQRFCGSIGVRHKRK